MKRYKQHKKILETFFIHAILTSSRNSGQLSYTLKTSGFSLGKIEIKPKLEVELMLLKLGAWDTECKKLIKRDTSLLSD